MPPKAEKSKKKETGIAFLKEEFTKRSQKPH